MSNKQKTGHHLVHFNISNEQLSYLNQLSVRQDKPRTAIVRGILQKWIEEQRRIGLSVQ